MRVIREDLGRRSPPNQPRKEGKKMNYKSVIEEQIRELQKLQDQNIRSAAPINHVIENAVKIAEQIRKIYVDVKGPLD